MLARGAVRLAAVDGHLAIHAVTVHLAVHIVAPLVAQVMAAARLAVAEHPDEGDAVHPMQNIQCIASIQLE